MVVRGVAEKLHAMLIFVGEFESHDVRPKLAAALHVTDAQDHMAEFFNFYRGFFICHRFLLGLIGSLITE
jgi:hypothetical protein